MSRSGRNNELLAIQAEVSAEIHADYVGRTVPVFVESVSRKQVLAETRNNVTLGWEAPREEVQLTGRTGGDLIVCFPGDASMIGRTVEVGIRSAAPLALFGEPVKAPA